MSILSRIFRNEKQVSQRKGIKPTRPTGLRIEALEDRQLLAASPLSPTGFCISEAGQTTRMAGTGNDGQAVLNFTWSHDASAAFGFVIGTTSDSGISLGSIEIRDSSGNVVTPVAAKQELGAKGGYSSRMVVIANLAGSVAGEQYTIFVNGQILNESAARNIVCEVYLPGDLNGDGLVIDAENGMAGSAIYMYGRLNDPHWSPAPGDPYYNPTVGYYSAVFGTPPSETVLKNHFLNNHGLYDLNFDGVHTAPDFAIATTNNTATRGFAANEIEGKIKFVVDIADPVITVPENGGEVVVQYETKTNPFTGQIENNVPVIYTATPEDAEFSIKAGSEIRVVTCDAFLPDNTRVNGIDLFGKVSFTQIGDEYFGYVTLDDILDAISASQAGGAALPSALPWASGLYVFKLTVVDDYGKTSNMTIYVYYEAVAEVAKPVVNSIDVTTRNSNLAVGEKAGSYNGNLNTYYNIAVNPLITMTDPSGGGVTFKNVATSNLAQFYDFRTDSWVNIPAGKVTYSISENGAFSLTIDPAYFAWLSTYATNNGQNQAIIQLPFTVANVFKKNSDLPADWATGFLTINITPANDTPVAVEDAVATASNAPKEVSVLDNDTDPDQWDTKSIKGLVIGGTLYTFADSTKVVLSGLYAGCKYIEVAAGQGNVWVILVPNNTPGATTLNSLAIDTNGAFNHLAFGQTATFEFNYRMNDAADAVSTAKVVATITGVGVYPGTISINENQPGSRDFTTEYPAGTQLVIDTTIAVGVATNVTDPAKKAAIEAAANGLALYSYISVNSTNTRQIDFSPLNGSASDFAFLGVGETLTLTYNYYVANGNGGSARTTVTVTIAGVNNTPVVTDWTTAPIAADATGIEIPLAAHLIDKDINDSHAFYQVYTQVNSVWAWVNLSTSPQAIYTINGAYLGTVHLKAGDATTLIYTPSSSEFLKWQLSNIPGFDALPAEVQFKAKDQNDLSVSPSSVSAAFTVTLAIAGVYDAPEITADQNLTLPVGSPTGPYTSNDLSGNVDKGYNAGWTLNTATCNGSDVMSYFTVVNGKIELNSAMRDAFVAAYMPEGVYQVDVFLNVTLGDGTNSDTEDITLVVSLKMPPVITVLPPSETIGGKEVALTGTTVAETRPTAVTADIDNLFVITDSEGDRPDGWYSYRLATLDQNLSYVMDSLGVKHTLASLIVAGKITAVQLPQFETEYSIDSDGDFTMSMVRGIDKIFAWLAAGDTLTVVFSVQVVDEDYGCYSEAYFALNVTGVNDTPTVTAGSTQIITLNDLGVFSGTDVPLRPNMADDVDWSDTLSVVNIAFTGGSLGTDSGPVGKTAAQIAAYFGLSESQMLNLITFNATAGNFEFAYNSAFAKLPVDINAILTYTFQVNDGHGGTSTAKTITIKITGTNQAPTGLSDQGMSVDLGPYATQFANSVEIVNPTYDVRTGISDVDTNPETGQHDLLYGEITDIATPVIRIAGSIYSGSELFINDAVAINASGVVTVDIEKLLVGFKALVVGQTATITYTYQVQDQHGAWAVKADGTTETASFTITVTGYNSAPTATQLDPAVVTMIPNANATDTFVELWSASVGWKWGTDPNTLPAGSADTVSLYSIAGTTLKTPAAAGADIQTIYVYKPGIEELWGQVVVHWTDGEMDSIVYYPIAQHGEFNSTNLFKWNLNDGEDFVVSISYVVKDNHGALSAPKSLTVTVTGVFDDMVLTMPTVTQSVFTAGAEHTIGGVVCVKLSGIYSYVKEQGVDYNFAVDSVTPQGFGTILATDLHIVDNGDGTLSLYVRKDAVTDIANVDKAFDVVISYTATAPVIDSNTGSFAFDVKAKSAPTVTPTTHNTTPINEQSSTTVSVDLATVVTVYDNDENKFATAFTFGTTIGLFDYSFSSSSWSLTAGMESAIAGMASINAAGQFAFVNNPAFFAFLAAGQSLTLTFAYDVVDYTVSGVKYEFTTTQYITVTINGQNNTPVSVGSDQQATVIQASTTVTNIKIADLIAAGYAYDADGNPNTALESRVSDIDTDKIVLYGWDAAGQPVSNILTAATAGTGTRVYLANTGAGTANIPYVTFELVDGQPQLRFYTNGAYNFTAVGDHDFPIIKYDVVDKAGVKSTENSEIKLKVNGEFIPISVTAPMANQSGNVAGYSGSTGQIRVNLRNYFNFAPGNGAVTWSIALPAGQYDMLKPGGLGENKSYWFEYNSVEDTYYLVFQLIANNQYDYTFNLQEIKGIIITGTDAASNSVSSAPFNVLCNQQHTLEILLVATTDVPRDEGIPQLPGIVIGDDENVPMVNYITAQTFNDYKSSTQNIIGKNYTDTYSVNRYGFYMEVWVKDSVLSNFTNYDPFTGALQLQFVIEYNTNYVKTINNPGIIRSDPNAHRLFGTTYTSSVGWGVSGSSTSDPAALYSFYTDVTFAGQGNTGAAYFAANYSSYKTNGLYSKGSDGVSALLLCRFWVDLENGAYASDAAFTLKSLDDRVYTVKNTSGEPVAVEEGYAFQRMGQEPLPTVNNSQVIGIYKSWNSTPITAAGKVEQVVDGGLYVRTVDTPTSSAVVKSLATSVNYIHEWQTHYAEIWIKVSNINPVSGTSFTFNYDPAHFSVTNFDFAGLFGGDYLIDYSAGTITVNANALRGFVSEDGFALVARATFKATDVTYTNEAGDLVSTAIASISLEDAMKPQAMGWSLTNGQTLFNRGTRIDAYLGYGSTTELWAVPFDLTRTGAVTLSDYSLFFSMFGTSIGTSNNPYFDLFDFSGTGAVTLSDYSMFFRYFGVSRAGCAAGYHTFTLPEAITKRYVGTTISTDADNRMVGVLLDVANDAWKDALGLDYTVDVRLIVTNRTDGQLATSIITKYDSITGLPIAGDIYLDATALGTTWFAQLIGASSNTAKYDLYTVLLHELGHIYGFTVTDKWTAFETATSQIDLVNGIHATTSGDLMFTQLEPGVRKTISTVDAYLLASAYAIANPGYVIPSALAEAWAAIQVAPAAIPAALPVADSDDDYVSPDAFVALAAAISGGVGEVMTGDANTTVLLAARTGRDAMPYDLQTGVTRATVRKINSLGINVAGLTVVENEAPLDAGFDAVYSEEVKEITVFMPEELATGSNDYEASLDIVLAGDLF